MLEQQRLQSKSLPVFLLRGLCQMFRLVQVSTKLDNRSSSNSCYTFFLLQLLFFPAIVRSWFDCLRELFQLARLRMLHLFRIEEFF